MGTGGQNIWNRDYSKKFRLYDSHRYIMYFIKLFKSIWISTHKIHVEKPPVGLPDWELFTSPFVFSLNNCFRVHFWSSCFLFIISSYFSSLPELLLLTFPLFMTPNSDLSSQMVFTVAYWSCLSVCSLCTLNSVCPKLKSYFSFLET